MENPIKMDDLGVPLFLEIPIYIYTVLNLKKAILGPVVVMGVPPITASDVLKKTIELFSHKEIQRKKVGWYSLDIQNPPNTW